MTNDREAIVVEISTEGRALRFMDIRFFTVRDRHGAQYTNRSLSWITEAERATRLDIDDARALAAENNERWALAGSLRRCRAMHPDDVPPTRDTPPLSLTH
jgi:hypothetical protein